MAIDLCSENAATYSATMAMSPRISFSHDLSQSDTVPVEQILRSFSSSSVDFNFCVHDGSESSQASMADELFSDGKILPTRIKSKKETHPPPPPVPPQSSPPDKIKPQPEVEEAEIKQQHSKSFWGFKRSSSCGSGYARSLCPIPLLSRSNSTGSSTSSKRSSSKEAGFNQKHHSQKSQKPPLRKASYSYGNSTSNGVRVNPVLNLGFGSFFSSPSGVKDKNKKK